VSEWTVCGCSAGLRELFVEAEKRKEGGIERERLSVWVYAGRRLGR